MITSLDLKNFKCFREFPEPLRLSRINVFTGSNGRGKSTILQALLCLAQSYQSGKDMKSFVMNGRFLNLGMFDDIVCRDSCCDTFSIDIVTDNKEGNHLSFVCQKGNEDTSDAVFKSICVDGHPLIAELGMAVESSDSKDSSDGSRESSTGKIVSLASSSTYESFSQLSNFLYVAADRLAPVNYVKRADGVGMSQIGNHGERVFNAFYEIDGALKEEISKELSCIMGGASIRVESLDSELLRIFLDSNDGTLGYKPVNVGFGYSYVLPLVVLPMIAPEGSKLVIENPEAHLHPGAQARLLNFLVKWAKSKNLQLFIETHSDHIINALRIAVRNKNYDIGESEAALVHLDRDNSGNARSWQIRIDKEGNLSDYPPEFMDEWTKQMLELV